MARYEHLPIYRASFDLAVHVERHVRSFSRYNKYTLGTDLRNRSRAIVEKVIEGNGSAERVRVLGELRHELESFKVLIRMCQEVGAFASAAVYLALAEEVVGISKQNEGWLRQAAAPARDRSGEAGHGEIRTG